MIYIKTLFAVVCAVSTVTAQIPNFGRCPDYDAMPDFDRESFMGKWYETERYFAVSELASRCVTVTYERRADGKVYVNNEMTNRFTNVQRIVSGVMNMTAKNDEATFTVKYTGLPVNYDTTMHVLDTDYDSFAVIWSCNPLAGPVGHTESVWILARERIPEGPVVQAAYGVLDKYKISRLFFVKTDQTNCETEPEAQEAEEVSESGYDIIVDDETVSAEQMDNNNQEDSNPQINQVQHIDHVENLQQLSPYLPIQPAYVPQIHHVHAITYYKQNDQPVEKSALNITDENKIKADDKIAEKKKDEKRAEPLSEKRDETKTIAQTKTSETIKERIQVTTVPIVLAAISKEQNAAKVEKAQDKINMQ